MQLSLAEMLEIVAEVGCCIAGQTESLCPADRLMYAARDVTNTVGCLGLIVSSIISKKAAEGINHLVLDVKWGSGCYQESLEQAELLAEALVQVRSVVSTPCHLSYAIKTQLKALKMLPTWMAFLPFAGSLWHKRLRDLVSAGFDNYIVTR